MTTWFNKVGEYAKQFGDVTGISDLVAEVADVASPDKPWLNELGDVASASLGVVGSSAGVAASAGWKGFTKAGQAYNEDVFQPIQDLGVFFNLAIAAPNFQKPGESIGEYLGAAWESRDQLSFGESSLDPSGIGKPWYEQFNPMRDTTLQGEFASYDPVHNPVGSLEMLRRQKNWVTGTTDVAASILMDPSTYIGAPVKAGTAGLRGAQLVSDAEKASAHWWSTAGKISLTQTEGALAAGKFDDSLRFLTQSTDAAVNAEFIRKAGWGAVDPDTAGFLTAQIDDVAMQKEFMGMLLRPQSEASKAASLKLKERYGADLEYYVQRHLGNDPLEAELYQSADGILNGPATLETMQAVVDKADSLNPEALARMEAFSRGVDKFALEEGSAALIRNAPTQYGFVARGTERKVGRSMAALSNDPVVSVYKPHRWHPATWYVEKPSGMIEPESPDALGEVLATFRQLDRRTNGQWTKSGNAQEFFDRWFQASTHAQPANERAKVAAGLNEAATRFLAKKWDPDGLWNVVGDDGKTTLDHVVDSIGKKANKAALEMREKGWLAMEIGDGEVGILRHPLLQRATPNAVHLYDFQALDRQMSRQGADGVLTAVSSARDNVLVPVADSMMAWWKVGVLFRLGYTIRNLAEASLSLAASGNLGHILADVGADRLSTWTKSAMVGGGRLIDNLGMRGGAWGNPVALSDQVMSWEGLQRATEANVKATSRRMSQAQIEKLAASGDPTKAALARRLETVRTQMVTEQVTYHGSASIADDWSVDSGRYLATSPSMQVADFNASKAAASGAGPAGQTTIFEALEPKGGTRAITSYGDTLDLTASKAAQGFDPVVVRGARAGDRNAIQMLSDDAYRQGYGRIVLPDSDEWGGVQVVVNPKATGPKGLQRAVEARLQKAVDEAIPEPIRIPGAAKGRAANKASKKARNTGQPVPLPVNPAFDEDLAQAMLDGGIEVYAQKLATRRHAVGSQLDVLNSELARAQKRVDRTARLGTKHKAFGQGAADVVSYNGVVYTRMPNAFEGHGGGMWEGRVGAGNTYKALAGDTAQGVYAGGRMAATEVQPTNPRYYEAWSNILNLHFRDFQSMTNDVMVDKILAGGTFDDLLDWAVHTREGYNWANSIGITRVGGETAAEAGAAISRKSINPDTVEQAVAGLMQAVDLYLPKGPIRQAFLGKAPIDQALLKAATEGKALTPLRGLLIPTSAEARQAWGNTYYLHRGVEKSMQILGSMPETSFARHPLFVSTFNRERLTRISIAEQNAGGVINAYDLAKIDLQAKQAAERAVERTLFTINRRSSVSGNAAVRTLAPFISAYENVLQRWTRFLVQDPTIALRASNILAKVNQGATVIDQYGNELTETEQWSQPDAMMVMPGLDSLNLPGQWGKTATLMMKQTNIPVKSLDVLMQGQIDPGLGPLGILPITFLIKRKPSAEKMFSWALPYGVPESYKDVILPTAMKRVAAMWNDGGQYTNTISKAFTLQQYLYEKDPINNPKPDITTAEKTAQSMTWLRGAVSLLSPTAATFTNERDWMVAKYRAYTDTTGLTGAAAKKAYEDGETRFFIDFPDAGLLVESLSQNTSGGFADLRTIDNTQKYRGLIADAYGSKVPEVAGFAMNYGVDNPGFSQGAYSWQRQNGPVNGSSETFREVGNPEDQVREAHVQEGWRLYREVVDGLSAQLTMQGYQPEDKVYQVAMTNARTSVADHLHLVAGNDDWYSEYKDPDTSKYMDRARAFQGLLANDTFMQDHGSDPLIRSMATFFAYRNGVEQELMTRDRQGGASTLTAKANADLATAYDAIVERMKVDSPEFRTWHDRFFINDQVAI